MHLFLVTASLFVCILLISLYVLWSWLLSVWLSVSVQLIASKDSFPRRSVYYLSVQWAVKHHSFSRPAKIQFHLILTDGVWGRCLVSDISGHGLPCLGLGLVSPLTSTCCLGCVSNFRISSWLNLVTVYNFVRFVYDIKLLLNVRLVRVDCFFRLHQPRINDNLLCPLMLVKCNRHLTWHCLTAWYLCLGVCLSQKKNVSTSTLLFLYFDGT